MVRVVPYRTVRTTPYHLSYNVVFVMKIESVSKNYAIKFCKMFSNGRLPFQHELTPLLKNPSVNRFFENNSATSPWASGSWDNISKRYCSDNQTIENVKFVDGYGRNFRPV